MYRFEDERLLRGTSRFVEDLDSAACLHAVFVRSPHAHARIVSFDSRAARESEGVCGVFGGRDFLAEGVRPLVCTRPIEGSDGTPFHAPTRHVLALEETRFVGDPVAMVVATSIDAAADAAERVEVEYEPLPVVVDSRNSDEVAVVRRIGNPEATTSAITRAAHVVRVEHANNRMWAAPLETRSAIGRYDADDDSYRLDTQSQGVHVMRTLVAASLGIDEDQLRVVTPDVGGSFGMKLVNYPEQSAVLVAARVLGAPVRWVSTRAEAALTDTHARGHHSVAELALDGEGRILALRCTTHGDMGAYASAMATASPVIGFACSLPNLYRIPVLDLTMCAAYTHTAPVDAFRGAGKPEGVYVMERLMDAAARQTGIDRMALRERNLVTPREMPYRAPNGEVWDCGDFPGVMRTALREAGWNAFESRRAASHAAGRRRGFGLGLYLHTAGAGTGETSAVEVNAQGRIVAYVGQQAIGQGHETTFPLLLSRHLGVPAEAVELVQGDTERLPPRGASTGGSASLQCSGTTLLRAADRLVDKLRPHAADALEAAREDIRFGSGRFGVPGTDVGVGLLELGASLAGNASTAGNCSASADFEGNRSTIPNGAYACEVEVDPDTGAIELQRLVGVNDVGRRIDPTIVDGQLHGGVAQGIGQAWIEHVRYEDGSGQLLSGTLMDYALPRADHFPGIELHGADIPTANNPIGAKGVGELGCVGAPAAFMSAVADAVDTQEIEMPATPERVWRALRRT
ncbi:MAG: xanthine dehydrogenase family protein molybdopterin-binding subunit [Thiotrichales bacterium]|nr:xanthine dehydrogenase family protein molybdopterin-binding subunit [Thiotrichales bacterium]